MKYPFRNLVFEGGGVKGIAYVGALEVLEKKGILDQIERVGGTSAGAINAVLLALGYSRRKMLEILLKMDFKSFLDDSWGVVRDVDRLRDQFGWYKGDFFREWIGKLVKDATGNESSTFNDLHVSGFRDLFLVGTNLSTGFAEIFSLEHTPRWRVVDAVRVSMSIPLFFASVRDMRGDVRVDGGVLDNYPIRLFDRAKYLSTENHTRSIDYYDVANEAKPEASSEYAYNMESLGFRLDTAREIAIFRDGAEPQHRKIDDLFDYAWALIQTIMNAQNDRHLKTGDWHRSVYIDTLDVGTCDFDLADEKKRALIEQGQLGTEHYFAWYESGTRAIGEEAPMNRPVDA
ncbi:patatin-like phospholipase family protein [Candidatus Bipolaricaulota bacterium]|nr:patatin-like phospholipase family protein [Candidatus Bipolaricaulota bacterium]